MQALFVMASHRIVGRVGMSFQEVTGVAGTKRGSMEEKGWRPWFGLLFLTNCTKTTHRKTRLTEIKDDIEAEDSFAAFMANTDHNLQPALDEQGLTASPQLPEGVKNYLIDIDGTITEDVPNEARADGDLRAI